MNHLKSNDTKPQTVPFYLLEKCFLAGTLFIFPSAQVGYLRVRQHLVSQQCEQQHVHCKPHLQMQMSSNKYLPSGGCVQVNWDVTCGGWGSAWHLGPAQIPAPVILQVGRSFTLLEESLGLGGYPWPSFFLQIPSSLGRALDSAGVHTVLHQKRKAFGD